VDIPAYRLKRLRELSSRLELMGLMPGFACAR